jgi:hypothetical protein
MPLDMAIKNAQQKTLTNVYDTYYFFVLSAITLATAFLTILAETLSHSALYLVICFSRLLVTTYY